ncbi:glycosyltransferase family 2 protein [Desulfobacterota bacterium M19]
MSHINTIAVLMTCFNRKEQTLSCLTALFKQENIEHIQLHIFLVDDGCTDGTGDAVRANYPSVNVLQGDGSLFWNGGMRLAFGEAMQQGFDYYLWLNDDTILYEQTVQQLLQTKLPEDCNETIVVGAVCDPDTGGSTYGGARFLDPVFRPFLCEVVAPNGMPQEVDVMNGNIVLVPDSIAKKLGNLDPVFEHAMGDTDYAMRARKLNLKILLTCNYVGCCSRNSPKGTYKDKTLSLKSKLENLFSRKGLPWRSWLVMCRRHGGLLWPVHFVWAYVQIILRRA